MKCKSLLLFIIVLSSQINMRAFGSWPADISTNGDSLNAQQLLVVITDNWDNYEGTLYGFKKQNHKWILQFSNAVVIGSKGMGTGEGIFPLSIDNAPVKKEGDLKSPAGIFKIGTAFGYASYEDAKWIKGSYIKASDTLICIDDIHSGYYNKLVKNDPEKKDWNSFEYMHRKDDYYKWGLFVNHNADKPLAGKGSCIFLHIWANDHEGTEGCTAMKEADMLRILHWINAKLAPILVQFPKAEYLQLAKKYNLPEIKFQ
jgi:L,D-peptidoglycan transpeptidase YkuD (ErfK/YbiS/YcfS/YnhG family)